LPTQLGAIIETRRAQRVRLFARRAPQGSVSKAGNRVRIVAQLIETETGAHI
jgi:TolB-like protein